MLAAAAQCLTTWRRWRILRQLPGWRGGAVLSLELACVFGTLLCLALGKPRRQTSPPRIACLLDCSASMAAKSGNQTRLDEGKQVLSQLARIFPQAELALVTFAGSTLVDYPFSNDHAAFQEALATADVGTVLLAGSAPALAIRQAEALGATVMVLCTDGESTLPAAPDIWHRRHTPLALLTCGREPAPIPIGDTFHQDPDTGQPAVSTPGSLLEEARLSSVPVVQLAHQDVSSLRAFVLQSLGRPATKRHWVGLALVLLLGALLSPQLFRLLPARPVGLLALLVFCVSSALAVPSESPLPFPDSTLPVQCEALRKKLSDVSLPPHRRAVFLSNLSAMLCRQAQLAPNAETIQEALMSAREALRLQPGLPAACANLALALRLESTLATAGTSSPSPIEQSLKNDAGNPLPSSRAQSHIPQTIPPQPQESHEAMSSTNPAFGSWRELQEKKARRNLRAAPTSRPW